MKKTLIATLLITPLFLTLNGCVVAVGGNDSPDFYSHHQDHEYENRKKISQLLVSMSYRDVYDKLGVPDFNETYTQDNENIQVLFYRTQKLNDDGITTKAECTPLVFKNGILASWGEKAYQAIL